MEATLNTRVDILEVKMDAMENITIREIKTDLKIIKDDLKTMQLRMDERFSGVYKEIGNLKGEIGSLRSELHQEIGGLRSELRGEMVMQTRWFMAALLATGMLVSVVAPLVLTLMLKWLG